MSTSYKADDYSTVSPYLIVDGASETIDFLKHVFGAIELRRFPDNRNKLSHAEVRIDDTVLMFTTDGLPDLDGYHPLEGCVSASHSGTDGLQQRAGTRTIRPAGDAPAGCRHTRAGAFHPGVR